MNKNSILFSITITFSIALILILISFSILFVNSKKREEHFVYKSNIDASRELLREHREHGFTKEVEDNLEILNFSLLKDTRKIDEILNNKKTKFWKSEERGRGRVRIVNLTLNDTHYVHIRTPRESYLLVNNNETKKHQDIIIFVFLAILSIFIFLYITTLKKLKSLKTLKDKVQNFGDEEFDISCASDKQDEISLLANEFDKSAKKLKKLKESRNVFIRNIMHELKTPITKGKFLVELPQTKVNNTKMQKVFYRLESLIGEFASIEELISTKKVLQNKEYHLRDIVDNAVDILMCDEDNVVIDFEDISVNVDFKLFSITIKNLIDNGIKYSSDKKVMIKTDGDKIIFENRGKELQYALQDYYEPFFSGENVKSNQSFGLGFYIIHNILNASAYNLEYIYENGVNKFTISPN
jgi:two-component system OmpR family sensor kinase